MKNIPDRYTTKHSYNFLEDAKYLLKKIIPNNIYSFYAKYRKAFVRGKNSKSLRFEVHLTEHCNLNCRGCTHFSPLAEEAYLDVNNFERDCARIASVVNYVREVELLGGEPLLHKDCTKFMLVARKYFPAAYISFCTNGILLNKQKDDFWNTCYKQNIAIHVSDYPININIDRIKKTISQFDKLIEDGAGGHIPKN